MSLTANSTDVIEFILGTKNFAILYDGVPIAERMDLNRGHVSTRFLCTLKRPYKTPSLEDAALIFYIAQHLQILMILKILNIR